MPASEMTATSSRPAADVDDHVAARLGDGKARSDRGRHRLLDQIYLARAGALCALLNGALLDLGDAERDADDDARLHERASAMGARDEVPQHGLGDLEVGDDPVAQRSDGADVSGRTPQHLLGLATYGEDLVAAPCVLLDGDDRRLARHDPLALDVNERVCRAEIDREIVRKQAVKPVEDHGARAPCRGCSEGRGLRRHQCLAESSKCLEDAVPEHPLLPHVAVMSTGAARPIPPPPPRGAAGFPLSPPALPRAGGERRCPFSPFGSRARFSPSKFCLPCEGSAFGTRGRTS